jgi:hypothetical protein
MGDQRQPTKLALPTPGDLDGTVGDFLDAAVGVKGGIDHDLHLTGLGATVKRPQAGVAHVQEVHRLQRVPGRAGLGVDPAVVGAQGVGDAVVIAGGRSQDDVILPEVREGCVQPL